MKLLDLTQPTSVLTPPWPTYPPLTTTFIKRLAEHRVNGQFITASNHLGTHLDGPLHFVSGGKDIASLPLERLYGEGVIVDLSDELGDYDIYTPKHVTDRVKVREGDILIINTGFHRHAWYEREANETAYFMKHPGPTREFAEWALKMKLRWIGVDCGSADHPMNTVLRKLRPDLAEEAEKKLGKPLDKIFPNKDYQIMHTLLFPYDIVHAENLGGDIEKLSNKRTTIGCFPWKFQGGESAFCRIVAFVKK